VWRPGRKTGHRCPGDTGPNAESSKVCSARPSGGTIADERATRAGATLGRKPKASNCPPASATNAGGIVFRFVAKDPIDVEDFRSHHELGLAPQSQPCRRCSLSVYKSLDVARDRLRGLRMRNPKRAERHIARGELTHADGKMDQAGQDLEHYEWWAFEGVKRHRSFRVIEKVEA
jgi:hypothetical protein